MARKTKQQREIESALSGLEPAVVQAFIDAIQAANKTVNISALRDAIQRGNIGEALRILSFPPNVLAPVQEAIRGAYISGGNMIAMAAPSALIAFSGATPRATAGLAELSSTRIQGIYTETLDAVRSALVAGRDAGLGADSLSRLIMGRRVGNRREGGIIGLTSQQAESIISARAKLSSGDPALMRDYFKLQLRDRRFDKSIQKAIDEGKAIAGAQLDNILDAHKSKAAAYRGRVIAKNETFSALEAGRSEAIAQALENPNVEGATKRWQHNLSQEPREDHVQMNGVVVPYSANFILPDGTQMEYAHDPSAGPEHTIGCKCITVYRIKMRT